MANTDTTQVITPSSSPVHYSALFEVRELQQRNNALLQQAQHPRRTEVSELLYRHYNDRSLIDEWTSWSYELSFWQKSGIYMSVISIAGLSGAVLGLAFPFIAIASSILYIASTLLNNHEQHRRDCGVRFAADNTALTEQLDSMMDQFRLIAAEMTTALEKVKIQAVRMSEQNTEIGEQTREHREEHVKLQDIITVVSEQSEHTEKVQNEIIAVVEEITSGLLFIPSHIDNTARAVDDFKKSIDQLAETTALMHHTEANLVEISTGLKNCVQRISTERPNPTMPFDLALETSIQRSQKALLLARTQRAELNNIDESSRLIMR